MKTGIYILMAIVFVSGACRGPKETMANDEVKTEETAPSIPEEVFTITGTVKLSPECGATIRVIQGDVMKYYHPVNLPEKFIVEGKKLEMDCVEVMAKMPAGCEYLVSVSVSNVKEVK